MRALALKSPGEAEIVEIAEPKQGSGDVLLRVRYVGMCGSDLNSFRGRNPLITYPRVPGHEIAATVVDAPADCQFQPGTDVTVLPYTSCGACESCSQGRFNACQGNQTLGVQRDGAMTEYISVPSSKLFTGDLSLKELCLVEPLTVGFHAAARGRVSANDTVAVFGCGGVGLGAIAASAFRRAKTIAIDLDDAKLKVAQRAGAGHTIHTGRGDLREALSDLTEGRGPSVIIEAIGLPQTFRAAVEEVAFAGRVVYIGYAKEPVTYETRFFVQKELDILGSRNAQPDDFRDVIRMLERRTFPVDETISTIVPLDQAADALRAWSDDPAKFQKIMVQIS